jgi:hypothetical protein
MAENTISQSNETPLESPDPATQDDGLPTSNVDDRRKPPLNMGNSRSAGEEVTDANPSTGRADARDRIPPPLSSRE